MISLPRVIGAMLISIGGSAAYFLLPRCLQKSLPTKAEKISRGPNVILVQLALIIISTFLVTDTSASLNAKKGLPALNSGLSWVILIVSLLIPILDGAIGSHHFLARVIVVFLTFAPTFILLSVRYVSSNASFESIFYFFFGATAITWMLLEREIYHYQSPNNAGNAYSDIMNQSHKVARKLEMKDLRIGTFFMFFINIAFFGTGNLASLSSFTIESVYRFTTVFDPFLMVYVI